MSPTTNYDTHNLNSSILVGGWMSGFRSMYSLTPSTLCHSTQVRVHTSSCLTRRLMPLAHMTRSADLSRAAGKPTFRSTHLTRGAQYCHTPQFAYNEMTFFLVRFLQTFDRMELAFDAQPADARPPAEWASGGGRKAIEKIVPKSSLTLFVKVNSLGVVFPIGYSYSIS